MIDPPNYFFFLFQAFLPLLKAAATSNLEDDYCIQNAAVVNISSVLGSINSNIGDHSGGMYENYL